MGNICSERVTVSLLHLRKLRFDGYILSHAERTSKVHIFFLSFADSENFTLLSHHFHRTIAYQTARGPGGWAGLYLDSANSFWTYRTWVQFPLFPGCILSLLQCCPSNVLSIKYLARAYKRVEKFKHISPNMYVSNNKNKQQTRMQALKTLKFF